MSLADRHIRDALHREVVPNMLAGDPYGFALDEMGLCGHSARVDIAVFNGAIHGIEIKSDRDTLVRLPKQIEVYGGALDKVTVVVGERHLKDVRKAVPTWWGITVAGGAPGAVSLDLHRPAKGNPSPDPYRVAQLLWREEALEELAVRGRDRGVRSKPRRHVWRRLADVVPLEELRERVRLRVKGRADFQAGGRRE